MTTFSLNKTCYDEEALIEFVEGEIFIKYIDHHSYKKEVNIIKINEIKFRKYEEVFSKDSIVRSFAEVVFEFDLTNLYHYQYRWLEDFFPYLDVDKDEDEIFLIDDKNTIIDLHNFLSSILIKPNKNYQVETVLLNQKY